MAMLNQIKRTGKRAYRRVGRGQGSSRGKQSGRGGKGQTARAGNKRRPELRDIIKKLPKRRGYGKNRGRTVVGSRPVPVAIPLSRLNELFESGAEVTPKSFKERGIVRGRGFKFPAIKIVSGGEISKKFIVKGILISASAKAALEKAGGTIAPLEVRDMRPSKHALPAKNL
jgi:large subunit ribosomal protein L15